MIDVKNEVGIGGRLYLPRLSLFCDKLSISDIRLLLVLSSTSDVCVHDLNCPVKKWVFYHSNYSTKVFSDSENRLIENGFLNEFGCGINLIENKIPFLMYEDQSLFDKAKNKRQLFFLSAKRWFKGKQIILSETNFYSLFGDTKGVINKNWKRTIEQTGVKLSWTKKMGSIRVCVGDTINNSIEDKIEVVDFSDNEIEWDFSK